MTNCIKCQAELPEVALYCMLCGKRQTPEPKKHRKRANGSGTIYKMPGNRATPWAAKKNNVFIGSFKTYAAAQKALERLTDVDITDKYNLTFRQIYDLWRPVHAREVTQSQMNCYVSAYKQASALHDCKFRTLRKSDFQAVILSMEESGKAKSTCEKVLQLFGQLSKWAMDEGIVNQNHAKNVKTTATQKSAMTAFTDDQIKAIQNATEQARTIVLVLIATGARPNELFKVPLSDCYDNYFIGGSKTQAGMRRAIVVSDVGLAAYQELLRSARAAGAARLIDGYEGNRDAVNFRKRDFKRLMDEIGCANMTPYNCRHTFSTRAVRAGVTPQMLSRMMGHADITTADKHYTHLDLNDILQEIKKIKSIA